MSEVAQFSMSLDTTTSWPRIRQFSVEIQAAIAAIKAGDYQEIPIP
jgi:hypothetical protein